MRTQEKTEHQATIHSSLPHSQHAPLTDADIEELPQTLKAITKLFVENYEEKAEPIHLEVTEDYISDYRNMPNYLDRFGERTPLIYIIQNHLQLYSVVEFAHTLSWMAGKILLLEKSLSDLQKIRINEVINAADYLFLLSKLNDHAGDCIVDVLN